MSSYQDQQYRPKELTVHAPMKEQDDFSRTNITIPVTVANRSSHTITYGGRVTLRSLYPASAPSNVVYVYFSDIAG
jgi:hypothetical protein